MSASLVNVNRVASSQVSISLAGEKYQNNNESIAATNSNATKNPPEFVRGGSRDNVRRIVEKEGKTARNLVAYSVPPSQGSPSVSKKKLKHKYPVVSDQKPPRGRTKVKKQTGSSKRNVSKTMTPQPDERSLPKANGTVVPPKKKELSRLEAEAADDNLRRESKSEEYQERVRKAIEKSADGGASPAFRPSSAASSVQSQRNLRARYWSYLFDNFHRSVDEIYETCENDESIIECQEVMLMLDVCKRDFQSLIHRLKLFSQIEASDVRPNSLSWEVRKQMSPGKSPSVNKAKTPSPAPGRYLNASKPVKFSWADRVRGVPPELPEHPTHANSESSVKTLENSKSIEQKISLPGSAQEVDDDKGWEVVKKGRSKSKSSSIVSSNSSNHSTLKGNNEIVKQDAKNENHVDGKLVNGEKVKKRLTNNFVGPLANSEPIKIPQKTNGPKNHMRDSAFCEREEVDKLIDLENHLEDANTTDTMLNGFKHENGDAYLNHEADICLSPGDEFGDDLLENNYVNGINGVDIRSDYSRSIDKIHMSSIDDGKSTKSYDGVTMDYLYGLTESEIKLTEENEWALATVIAEEKTLTKELEEEALKEDDQDDDISSERGYTTTEDGCETPKDVSDELPLDSVSLEDTDKSLTWDELCAQYEREHENVQKFTWGERMEMSESVRMPGRALEMHQKLSSPSRKKSRSESVKRSEERMARAERRRLRLLVEKCERLRDLSSKVQKVRELKNMLIAEKERNMMEQMKRAEINRQIALQEKVKKAQEEELKVHEIAFINTLEAQNKKIEVQEKHQVSEARLQDLVDERQRRREDKHAKEEAAQERRRALEQERLARLQEIKQKRGDQAAKWQKERYEREKAREELAKEKQRERDMKVAARNEAMQTAAEELLKRIELKHIESTRRHEQRIEEVKEKSRAASSSRHATVEDTPSCVPYEKLKKCTLCDVEIASDVYMVSHLKGPKHKAAIKDVNKKITDAEIEAFSSKYIKEAEPISMKRIKEQDDRAKAMKKRAKKIRARMISKGKEYESVFLSNTKSAESAKQGKFQKCIKDINKVLQAHCNGPWPANKVASLDKPLSEIMRSLEDKNTNDQRAFCQLGGLTLLSRVLLLWDTTNSMEKLQKTLVVPPKIIKHASEAITAACYSCTDNCQYMLHSNKISLLVDLLAFRLKIFEELKMQEKEKEKEKANQIAEEGVDGVFEKYPQVIESPLSFLQQDDGLTLVIMSTLTTILKVFHPRWNPKENAKEKKNEQALALQQRLVDLVSYVSCSGIMEKLITVYRHIQGPFEEVKVTSVIITVVNLLQHLTLCVVRLETVFGKKKDDAALITQIMKNTEAFGLVALMYSFLHQGSTIRISPSPLPLAESTMFVLTAALKTLNILALADLETFQSTVASEGISLQYRSVISYLLRYSSNENQEDLLHELVLSLGYFTALNEENQTFIQSGRAPSLLQQLCTLPFKYFSDPKLKNILFPTVICICYKNNENIKVVAQDVSPTLLAIYLEEMTEEKTDNPAKMDDMDQRSMLDLRFPQSSWEEAKSYFTEKDDTPQS